MITSELKTEFGKRGAIATMGAEGLKIYDKDGRMLLWLRQEESLTKLQDLWNEWKALEELRSRLNKS